MKNPITIGLGVKAFDIIWDYMIYPAALRLVNSTENKFDDEALKFMAALIEQIEKDLINKQAK